MTRAIETSAIIQKHLPNSVKVKDPDNLLREVSENNTTKSTARMKEAFKKYFCRPDESHSEDTYDVVVCHGNVINYFCHEALQNNAREQLRLKHGSITSITVKPDGIVVRKIGYRRHIKRRLLKKHKP